MESFNIYKDIALRTNGEIFVGVVGPVRTGKSTFITKFMEKFVIPNMNNKLQKQIAVDEMPQSADGKNIMTTQPKFVPANAVKVQFKNKTTANVRLIDCVGYMVDGANGHLENDKPRLVKTPWSEKEIPFEEAADIGTKKVIEDYSTIGVLLTQDGSFGEIDRKSFVQAEERVVRELKKCNKPFVIVLNCKNPKDSASLILANELEEKYNVSVVCCNALNLDEDTISEIMEKVLLEFPILGINVKMPKWMQALPLDNPLINGIIEDFKLSSKKACKMKDFSIINDSCSNNEQVKTIELEELSLGSGVAQFNLCVENGLFYKVLSQECSEQITDDYDLMHYIKSFSESKNKFAKIKDALKTAEEEGYGVVLPLLDELKLEQPTLVKQGGRYGVKLKATAPSLHIIKVDVSTEFAPTVGSEKQGQDMVDYITSKYDENPEKIWEANMFGKSLKEMVDEGLADKLNGIPKDAQGKMRKTLTRMVNENKGGIICILL